MTRSSIRIGCGAGYSGDRIEPALELVEQGQIDYLVFECLAERTIALAQQARRRDPNTGFDPLLESRMRAVLGPALQRGVRIVNDVWGLQRDPDMACVVADHGVPARCVRRRCRTRRSIR